MKTNKIKHRLISLTQKIMFPGMLGVLIMLSACAQNQPDTFASTVPPPATTVSESAVLAQTTPGQIPQESPAPSNIAVPPAQVAPIQEKDHPIDETPAMLTSDQAALSLEGYGALGALKDTELSVYDMLMYAVQDEYLAHGEYMAIMDKFGRSNPYANIARSEETHLAMLEKIFVSYNLEFPADSSADHLLIPDSLLSAAKTGVQAEIDNIAMYEKFLTYDLPDGIADVFTALMKGSESHLLAFQKQEDRLS